MHEAVRWRVQRECELGLHLILWLKTRCANASPDSVESSGATWHHPSMFVRCVTVRDVQLCNLLYLLESD